MRHDQRTQIARSELLVKVAALNFIPVKVEYAAGWVNGLHSAAGRPKTTGKAYEQRQLVLEISPTKWARSSPSANRTCRRFPLTLTEAELFARARGMPGVRPPFSLVFLAKDPRVLPQRLYRMEHDDLGVLEIFLVPIAKDAQGVSYQATFN